MIINYFGRLVVKVQRTLKRSVTFELFTVFILSQYYLNYIN